MAAMKELSMALEEYNEARQEFLDDGRVASTIRFTKAADDLARWARWMANVDPPKVQRHVRGPDCRCNECKRDYPRAD